MLWSALDARTAAGNVGFATGSAYQVQVNQAGQSDLIAATGHATLTGGTVQVSGTPASNLTYTILTAQGGVGRGLTRDGSTVPWFSIGFPF